MLTFMLCVIALLLVFIWAQLARIADGIFKLWRLAVERELERDLRR